MLEINPLNSKACSFIGWFLAGPLKVYCHFCTKCVEPQGVAGLPSAHVRIPKIQGCGIYNPATSEVYFSI